MSVILGLIVPRSHARPWDDESVSGVAVIKVGPSGSHGDGLHMQSSFRLISPMFNTFNVKEAL